ncbi:M28 family peptidase [Treponema pectinovorum]|uniref:M28 family peptidase n=1 Tax=Treponema pectinovorum TaxID=164 RepID=UPI0011F0CCBF|nr:M28 family peptidase [Treponema pectinovorum]
MSEIQEALKSYVAEGTDRLAFLQDYLSCRGVSTSVIHLDGKKHLYVNFSSYSYNPQFKIKTLITHYDIVKGSPGANDNSCANLAIANFAVKVNERAKKNRISNIRIFFTDGEELGECGVSEQGAFALAELFCKLGIKNDDVYVFDSVGRGTTPVLARAGFDFASRVNKNSSFAKNFLDLYKRTQQILSDVSPNNWMTLPVPYSDNAGFLACAIPAVAITMLPKEEATKYYKELMKDKNLEKAVMNAKLDDDADFKFKYQERMPLTWRLFHTPYDNLMSLTPESFDVIARILDRLLI